MIYFIWQFVWGLLYKAKIDKKFSCFFLFFFLWAIMSFRSIDLGINDTKEIYLPAFNICQQYSLAQVLSDNLFINEPLMTCYTWILSQCFQSFQLYISLSCLITLFSFYYFIKNNSTPFLGVLIFFSTMYFYESFLIKQMLALSFILFSYKFLIKRSFVKFFLLVLIAGLFHKSAYFVLLLYFLSFVKLSNPIVLFTSIVFLFVICFKDQLLYILSLLPYFNFSVLIRDGVYSSTGDINFSHFLYFFIFIFCYFRLKNRDVYNSYLWAIFVGFLLNLLSVVVVEFYRFSLYFLCVSCVLIPLSLSTLAVKLNKFVSLLFIVFFVLYSYKTALNCNCLFYSSFFDD